MMESKSNDGWILNQGNYSTEKGRYDGYVGVLCWFRLHIDTVQPRTGIPHSVWYVYIDCCTWNCKTTSDCAGRPFHCSVFFTSAKRKKSTPYELKSKTKWESI